MKEKLIDLLTDIVDNDTMIIIAVFVLAMSHPQYAEQVIVGLIAFLGLKKKGE